LAASKKTKKLTPEIEETSPKIKKQKQMDYLEVEIKRQKRLV
jgi:hypothetical protein